MKPTYRWLISTELFKSYIKPETKLVILSHASNVTGTVQPLEEIGKQYGITREAVRQIEKHSLEKLRLAIRVKNTQDFFKRIDNNKQLSKQYFRYDI